MIGLRRLRVDMTALVREEVKATLSTIARVWRGHTVAALAQPDHGQREQPGGLVEPLRIPDQFGAQSPNIALRPIGRTG